MSVPVDKYPKVGELIIGTCKKVSNHGAYCSLDGYGELGEEAGFVHISELSKTWVRNIRQHIQLNQKVVCKVLRVNPSRNEVDLSIRRVTESQRRGKLQEYKHEQRAQSILRALGTRMELNETQMTELMTKMRSESHALYDMLLITREEGAEALTSLGVDTAQADAIYELVQKELEPPTVSLIGIVTISIYEPNGIEILREAFVKATDALSKDKEVDSVDVSAISAPDYRVVIVAGDWKSAEKSWAKFQATIQKSTKKYDVEVTFRRD